MSIKCMKWEAIDAETQSVDNEMQDKVQIYSNRSGQYIYVIQWVWTLIFRALPLTWLSNTNSFYFIYYNHVPIL
jgi:hypothetical protein